MLKTNGQSRNRRQAAPLGAAGHGERDSNTMGGFAKGLAVIEAFDRDRDQLTIADVARATGLDRATARRCLLTLVARGYATTDGKLFRLSPKTLRLGYAYLAATPLPRLVQPFLEQLSEATDESCSASVLDGSEIVYIARAAQRRVMSIGLNVGSRLPAYCASMGRVLLSALPPAEAKIVLEHTERRAMTAKTITSLAGLMRALAAVRDAGYAIIDEELELGLRSIAVPILDQSGRVVAAFNIGAQVGRVSLARMESEFLPRMRTVQAELARLLPPSSTL